MNNSWNPSVIMATVADAAMVEANGILEAEKTPNRLVFVLGGPGSGKGTQSANILQHFGYTHISTGDLLRAEINRGGENAAMIQNMIKEGKIVPPKPVLNLLRKAMQESGNNKFLLDGFPRDEETRLAFEAAFNMEPEFVLLFDCPEEEMERRLLNRNEARIDDNIESIRKRFKVFRESTLPVVEFYASKGKLRKVDASKPVEEVFDEIKSIFISHEDNKIKKRRGCPAICCCAIL